MKNGLKIGVIGLTTVQTAEGSLMFKDGDFKSAQFFPYAKIVRKESAKLRERGANAVLLLSHIGNACNVN